MNTKLVMTLSSAVLGVAGIALTFLPAEILTGLAFNQSKSMEFLLQIIGALYFAFAMLNWMTKASLIGGIYNRPIAVANLTHFVIVALALVKGVFSNPDLPTVILTAAIVYSIFAVLFGIILFRHPVPEKS